MQRFFWGAEDLILVQLTLIIQKIGKNTLYGIDMTEVSECELIYQKY